MSIRLNEMLRLNKILENRVAGLQRELKQVKDELKLVTADRDSLLRKDESRRKKEERSTKSGF